MDKQIVLIGNGKSVLNNKNGELIDSFNNVVRFNFFFIDGYEQYVGTKLNIWFTTLFDKSRLSKLDKSVKIIEHCWNWNEETDNVYQRINDFGVSNLTKTKREVIKEMQAILGDNSYHTFSTGAIALYMLAQEYTEISIYGFDWWETDLSPQDKHHYADNYKMGYNHKPDKELRFIKELSKKCKIFNINTNEYITNI